MRDGNQQSDAQFLAFLRERLPAGGGTHGGHGDSDCLQVDALSHLQLRERDVAKVGIDKAVLSGWLVGWLVGCYYSIQGCDQCECLHCCCQPE